MAKFYYNGVLLPEIPQDVLAENPYCWIRKNTSSGEYDLCFAPQPWYFSNGMYFPDVGSVTSYRYTVPIATYADATEWTFAISGTFSYYTVDSSRTVLWSNHDIPNGSTTSTTFYFAGTNPIPEHYEFRLILSIEAESGTLGGSAKVVDRASYSANVVVDGITASNGSLTLDFVVPSDDYYLVKMYFTHSDTREFSYTSNGKKYVISVVGTSYYTIESINFPIYFTKGKNTVVFTGGSTTYAPMFDRFDVYQYRKPFKQLIRDNGIIYTITDNVLVPLQDVVINSLLFSNTGFDKLYDYSLLSDLTSPEILYWTENADAAISKATLTATPNPQSIVTNSIDLSHPTIIGINSITGEYTGSPMFACEFNGVWKEYDGTAWVNETSGMTFEVLTAITPEQWDEMTTGLDSFKMKVILDSADDKVVNLKVNYNFDITQAVSINNEEVVSGV